MADLKDEITPEPLYRSRRWFLQTSIYALSGLATYGLYRNFRGWPGAASTPLAPPPPPAVPGADVPTSFEAITNYNNFYEFSTDKQAVAPAAREWQIPAWSLEIDGLVKHPQRLDLAALRALPTEQRVYRFRCVEGWSMVIPWRGLPLARLLEQAQPLSSATHVAFETFFDPAVMPAARSAGIPFPYVEGLRLDEALHPLTLIATGLYGRDLPNQNGAPVRLVVPWKYGFKSIKSLVKIRLVDKEPPTTWNIANPQEYGFYSNVNPAVDHPRWSQKQERRIGELRLRDTLLFNGYEAEVASLYRGMDLREHF